VVADLREAARAARVRVRGSVPVQAPGPRGPWPLSLSRACRAGRRGALLQIRGPARSASARGGHAAAGARGDAEL